MSKEISTFSIKPSNFSEAMEFSRMIAKSSFCPAQMRNKPEDVLLAMQMGSEVGLSPMQALQNIAVMNGKPCLYGDGALAVIISHPHYERHNEWLEGTIEDGTLIAYCMVKRKGNDEYTKSFSMADARKAGLWGKPGPWTQYPDRMLQMRARAFAIRDKFADALRGISVREEVEDYQVIPKNNNKPAQAAIQVEQNKNTMTEQTIEDAEIIEVDAQEPYTIEEALKRIKMTKNMEDLKSEYERAYKAFKSMPEELHYVLTAKDTQKVILDALKQGDDDDEPSLQTIS